MSRDDRTDVSLCDAVHVSMLVGLVLALGAVQEYQRVAECVLDNRESPDRNVMWPCYYPAAMGCEDLSGVISRTDFPVWLVTVTGGEDDLGRRVGTAKADGTYRVVSPDELVAEESTVEAKSSVQIRHRDRNSFNISKKGFHAGPRCHRLLLTDCGKLLPEPAIRGDPNRSLRFDPWPVGGQPGST